MKIKDYLKIENSKAYIRVKVIPKSPITEFFAVLDDKTLKIRIKAIPERWKANKELIKFLSKELWVKKDNIKIISWAFDQIKIIRIDF